LRAIFAVDLAWRSKDRGQARIPARNKLRAFEPARGKPRKPPALTHMNQELT
jgi:hypothetical protein